MKIFNRLSSKKDGQNPSGGKIIGEKALDCARTHEELKPFFALCVHCFRNILADEKEIEQKVKQIQDKTQQNLKEDQLIKELWILRYVCLHIWFFELKSPKNQNELSDELLVINSALKDVLKEKSKLDYSLWLKDGLSEFAFVELNFNNLKNFRKNFSDKLAEKIQHIAFECTEGRLGGELHDFVIELVMTTIQKDQKVFSMSDQTTLTDEEYKSIKDTITEMSETRQGIAKDFIEFFR